MTPRQRLPRRVIIRVLVPGVVGLVLVSIAFAVKTVMGSGSGHRYVPIDIVQLVGSALILLSATLAVIAVEKNRRSR
jgi:hypothetical protein